jgi:hypothetical protein
MHLAQVRLGKTDIVTAEDANHLAAAIQLDKQPLVEVLDRG